MAPLLALLLLAQDTPESRYQARVEAARPIVIRDSESAHAAAQKRLSLAKRGTVSSRVERTQWREALPPIYPDAAAKRDAIATLEKAAKAASDRLAGLKDKTIDPP